MAWIEVHQSLVNHPKLGAAEQLKIDELVFIGHLINLWSWALDIVPPDGDITGVSPRILAKAARWKKDPEVFRAALIEWRWIDDKDGHQYLHDWWDYAGKFAQKRAANAAKARRWREAHNGYVTDTSPSNNGATLPYPTVPITITGKEEVVVERGVRGENKPSPQVPTTTTTFARTWEDSVGRPITETECKQLLNMQETLEQANSPPETLSDAIIEAAKNGKEKVKLRYVETILERWAREGRGNGLRAGTNKGLQRMGSGTPRLADGRIDYEQAVNQARGEVPIVPG